MEDFLTLTHATERDVDLLLVEELKCSDIFVRWFSERVGEKCRINIPAKNSQVVHSKRRTHNRREIDIALYLTDGAHRTLLLIENKLDTSEQPRQAESYREEAQLLVSRGEAERALTVLVCPNSYAQSQTEFSVKFDCNMSYEEIATFLESRAKMEKGEIANRLTHRAELLGQAITKARRGYVAVPMAEIEDFNAKYISAMSEVRSSLKPGPSMVKPGRPGESKTMIFAPDSLPNWDFLPQMRIVHQLREANANINFYGWGNHFTNLAGIIAPDLAGTGYRLVPTSNKRVGGNCGLMIVVDTPAVDNLLGFDQQRDAIKTGIVIVTALQQWFAANKSVIERWAKAARDHATFPASR
jgi:hypothetical protein